jgi:hypothetical protein
VPSWGYPDTGFYNGNDYRYVASVEEGVWSTVS